MRPKAILALSCVIFGLLPACYAGAQARNYEPPTRSVSTPSGGETLASMPGVMVENISLADSSAGDPDISFASAREQTVDLRKRMDDASGSAPPPPPPPPPVQKSPQKDEPPGKESPTGQASPPADAVGKKLEGDGTVAVMRAPMLVYTARVNMAVYEVKSSLAEVESLARTLGGFLARRNDQSITIRVPATRFDEAIRRIEKLGDMLSRDVQVEDVTEEYHDTEIRLKNARAVRQRLEQLLAKATKVEESIQIEKELERLAETIDRLEGRMKFLRDRAAFSTITVTFQPQTAAELGKRPFNLPVPWIYELGLGRLLSL